MGFMLEIVTPERAFYEGEVDRVIVKGVEGGEMAILKKTVPQLLHHWLLEKLEF